MEKSGSRMRAPCVSAITEVSSAKVVCANHYLVSERSPFLANVVHSAIDKTVHSARVKRIVIARANMDTSRVRRSAKCANALEIIRRRRRQQQQRQLLNQLSLEVRQRSQ